MLGLKIGHIELSSPKGIIDLEYLLKVTNHSEVKLRIIVPSCFEHPRQLELPPPGRKMQAKMI